MGATSFDQESVTLKKPEWNLPGKGHCQETKSIVTKIKPGLKVSFITRSAYKCHQIG
jgi:hypothetical protein